MSNHTPERLQDREIAYANCDQFGEDDHLLKTVDGDINVVARMKRCEHYDAKTTELWPHLAACWNALRGLDVAKVEALLDAFREHAKRCNDYRANPCEDAWDRANEAQTARRVAIDALADSIRAGGAQ